MSRVFDISVFIYLGKNYLSFQNFHVKINITTHINSIGKERLIHAGQPFPLPAIQYRLSNIPGLYSDQNPHCQKYVNVRKFIVP